MNMLESSAAIASYMMFIGSRDGLFYAFGLEITPCYISQVSQAAPLFPSDKQFERCE
jgi:hypothetical protein